MGEITSAPKLNITTDGLVTFDPVVPSWDGGEAHYAIGLGECIYDSDEHMSMLQRAINNNSYLVDDPTEGGDEILWTVTPYAAWQSLLSAKSGTFPLYIAIRNGTEEYEIATKYTFKLSM